MDHGLIIDALEWEVLKSSVSSKIWIQLIKAVSADTYPDPSTKANAINIVYERAVRALPYSYKLWSSYLRYRQEETKSLCTSNEWFQSIRELFERALERLPQMPLLWVSYLQFVISSPVLRIVMVRHIIGRSLCALPVTQHHLIWRTARVWCAHSAVPTQTFKAIWSVYLQFDCTVKAQTQYFTLLFHRGNNEEFLQECIRVLQSRTDTDPLVIDRAILEDPGFWEPIAMIFQSVGWYYSGEIKALTELVEYGSKYCASPHYFSLSYAMFLYGQGLITQGRQVFTRLLSEAPSPVELQETYHVVLEMENQLVESFALSEGLRDMDASQQARVVRHVFADASPLDHLRYLVHEYPMWLNQAQIRCSPLCVPLWLKRVELLQERRASAIDVESLFRQAIAHCTSGMREVDAAVGQLFHSFVCYLISQGKHEEAVQVLAEGAWDVPFTAVAINADLLGLYGEIRLGICNSSHLKAVMSVMLQKLLTFPQKRVRARREILATSAGADASAPRLDYRPWLLLADLCITSSDLENLHGVLRHYLPSSAFTAESCAYTAHSLWKLGDDGGAARVLELGLNTFRPDDGLSVIFLVDQYISFLIANSRKSGVRSPMHHVRELFRVGEEAAPTALLVAPAATLNLLVTWAWLEAEEGLFGNAVQMLQHAVQLALKLLPVEPHRMLLICIIERVIHSTHTFKGHYATREYCRQLLGMLEDVELLQRVALHWSALERRCGEHETAHLIMDASCPSQDPSSAHGAVYWQLWESLCANVSEFEKVKRRREQVAVRFAKTNATS
ncbi:unnamed protein product [Phytomonas sp. EM1]|nr:unnamed protein product [Phytomonas sp. EM1]|eukprot:CCW65047.1 unnamed protein product [Phytomonas sp. isolate EM1]